MGVSPQAQALVDAFAARGLSLSPYVAELWYGVERGSYHNLVGVTSPSGQPTFGATSTVKAGSQWLNVYPSDQAGADAAASLVATAPQYQGLRAALTPGHSWQDQLKALIASPWNHGYYTSALGGYVDPSGAGPGGTQTLADFLGLPSSTVLTPDLALQAAGKYAKANAAPGRPYQFALNDILGRLKDYIGRPIGEVPFFVNAQGKNPTGVATGSGAGEPKGSILPDWGTELAAILAFLLDPVNWERIGFVALGLLAGTAGFILYVRGHSGVRTA